MNPVELAKRNQIAQAIAMLPPSVRGEIGEAVLAGQKTVLPTPYWSTIRYTAAVVAATSLTLDMNPRRAFAYAAGGDGQVAGFAAAFQTSFAETNLTRAAETLDNADVYIYGLAIEPRQGALNSDPRLAAAIWDNAFLELSFNGSNSLRLGRLGMFPGAGGLYGAGVSASARPPLNIGGAINGGQGAQVGFMSNGNPQAGSFYRFPQPFKWAGVGGAGADSSLNITCQLARQVVLPLAADRVAAAGTDEAFTGPAAAGDAGTVQDITFRLISVSVANRSKNI